MPPNLLRALHDKKASKVIRTPFAEPLRQKVHSLFFPPSRSAETPQYVCVLLYQKAYRTP